MKAATVNELKKELKTLSETELVELCARLGKYKKENKELITYLLFEAQDEQGYIKGVKAEIDEQLAEMNMSNIYLAKKTIRKVLRTTNKYIRYSGSKQTMVELLIYFCSALKETGVRIDKSTALSNLYERQIIKINKTIEGMHEDLQYDYRREMKRLL